MLADSWLTGHILHLFLRLPMLPDEQNSHESRSDPRGRTGKSHTNLGSTNQTMSIELGNYEHDKRTDDRHKLPIIPMVVALAFATFCSLTFIVGTVYACLWVCKHFGLIS